MIEYFGCDFLPEKLLLWCLVMIITSKFQLWCTQEAGSHWSGLGSCSAVFSPQGYLSFFLGYLLDKK